MDLKWLNDALVLLEEQNLSRAAARQNVTQPAFSRRIRNFEAWLGSPILERGNNKVDISPALRANEAEIRALTERIYELRGRIANFEATSSTVTIAAQHAPIQSTFPDMAAYAKQRFPAIKFRLRAGDHRECTSIFLRGDTNILLCYEAEGDDPMPFSDKIKRAVWGTDYLVPVVGGGLRYKVAGDGSVSHDLPAVSYPSTSYFGEVLGNQAKRFSTRALSLNVAYETAFSNGIKELVLKGMGVGWLPLSMCYNEVESGVLITLTSQFGRVPVQNALYAYAQDDIAIALLEAWGAKGQSDGASGQSKP